ncbi:bifunctional 3,4-dihydroxy-2-butanone-4-phosphate synthase/GTP cyclohydrolase II [Zooshikella ganghwensis]|uniref:3,4-dihydroxy-2-butanone 4-phosphate synthase n=1 Tax=Zooshikella ganghwensis TaxID=202772 RepID=A0A4P9VHM9_9GAMM|nr:bifunctional 3,4-dihydroxy-2-butanone-4-phosphate synthase/GTP cyclohydrolase II [Zooshikella ganghwensis]RDH42688.1 3,4-dihydroxy-2-butanone-4-phosphate synthase [Zooshikella ganghwensis]
MKLNTIPELLEDLRLGKMIILMDDEDRENEGDLIMAADLVTPEAVNFMVTHARGLVCLPMTTERCDYLGLTPMVPANKTPFGTHFTVSIEAVEGVTTGISAADRARTIQVAVDPNAKPEDIVQPGHIFPLRAQPGGVLSRAGHTEAGCDLARLAGLTPAAVIVEIMNEDGTMARRPDLELFAEKHQLKIGTIAELIQYRILHEKTVVETQRQPVLTEFGEFELVVFHDTVQDQTHLALVKGDVSTDEPVLVRVHVADAFRDLLGAQKAESPRWTFQRALKVVAEEGRGVVVLLDSEQTIDFAGSMQRFFYPDKKGPRNPAFNSSGAYLTVGTGSQILRLLGVTKMRLMSSPIKFSAISGFDLEIVEYISCT